MIGRIYLTTAECSVLEALSDGAWRTPTELTEIPPAAALHVQVVRGALKQLAYHRLAVRGIWPSHAGWWRIAPAGLERINHSRQLDLRMERHR